jgi:hypothetical protein
VTSRRRDVAIGVGLLAIPATLAFTLATRHGLGLDGDSATYLDLARSIRLGDGPTTTGFGAREPVASAHFPPLYPLWLAIFGTWRWANLLLYLATAVVAAVLLERVASTDNRTLRRWAILFCGLPLLLHPSLLSSMTAVASESLFLPLMLGALATATSGKVLATILLTSAALLTRHVGIVLLLLPAWAVWADSRGGQRTSLRRLLHAGLTTVAGALPYLGWRCWTWLDDGVHDRVLRWHPPTSYDWLDTLATFAHWVIPLEWPTVLAASIGLLVAAGTLWCLRRMPLLLTIFVSYIAAVLVARTWFDATIPMGGRIWTPLLPIAWLALLGALRLHDPIGSRRRSFLAVIVAAWSCVILFLGYLTIGDRFEHGTGYNTPTWRSSQTLAFASNLDQKEPVVSNAADVIHVLLRRPASFPPMSHFPTADRPNTRRFDQIRELQGDPITFVFFTTVDRDYFVSADDVRRLLDVEEVARFDDGFALRSR